MVDHEDREEDDDFEGDLELEQMIGDNLVKLEAVMRLLKRKGLVSEEELESEIDKVYTEFGVMDDSDEDEGE